MYEILVSLRNGMMFRFITDSPIIAERRLAEFKLDPSVRWVKSENRKM